MLCARGYIVRRCLRRQHALHFLMEDESCNVLGKLLAWREISGSIVRKQLK